MCVLSISCAGGDAWQMEEADSLYIMLQGNVSVEASFVELPTAQRAVDFPVNVSSSSGWCAAAGAPADYAAGHLPAACVHRR